MPKFNKGDKVRIRLDNASPFRGRSGSIDEEPIGDSFGYWYMVKFTSKGFARSYRFPEEDLELLEH
jgi:hypothetical protein